MTGVDSFFSSKHVNDSIPMIVFIKGSFQELSHFFILIVITFLCTLITISIAIIHMLYVSKYVTVRRLRNNLYYVVALNPICALCCLFGMMMPRNLAFLQGVILTYQMLTLRITIDILFNISGGRRILSDQLKDCSENIAYKVFPFCCCPCLPEVTPSVRNIRKLENIISQTCVIRIVLQVADTCVMKETEETHNLWFLCSYFLSFITMVTSLYVSCIIANLNRDRDNKFRYNFVFYMVNVSQIVYTCQRTLASGVKFVLESNNFKFSSLIDYNYFEETYYHMFGFSVEVTIMSIIISIVMRPSVSRMFDAYSSRSNSQGYTSFEHSGREDKESKAKEAKKESRMGPNTVMKNMGESDSSETKKAKIPGAVEDDGNYENLNPANEQDLKKVLKNMEKKG